MDASVYRTRVQFELIAATSSRLGKEALLETYQQEWFKAALRFVYDPFIVVGLSKKKLATPIDPTLGEYIATLDDLMNYLILNNTGRHVDIATVRRFAHQYSAADRDFIYALVAKDIPIGATAKTLNKVYGTSFIRSHEVQLATALSDKNMPTSEFVITQKLDGNRVTAFKFGGNLFFYTRSGKNVFGLDEITDAMKDFPDDYVYDGELLAKNPDGLDSKDLFRLSQTIIRKDGPKTGLEFFVFDAVPYAEWFSGKSKQNYTERRKFLNELPLTSLVKVLPVLYTGKDVNVIPELLEDVTSSGGEGLMINICDRVYENKRSTGLLKVKKFDTVDLRITGKTEHTRNANTLGALIVDYKGYPVQVGSGFTDQERTALWNADITGKIVEVQYFEETTNADETLSLRFPVFVRMRDDKDEESYN